MCDAQSQGRRKQDVFSNPVLKMILLVRCKRFMEAVQSCNGKLGMVCTENVVRSEFSHGVLDSTWRCREGQGLQDTGGLDT
jgi:hypothetical protein